MPSLCCTPSEQLRETIAINPSVPMPFDFCSCYQALSNQSQLPQCRQHWRQLQHCLSSNCRKQSSWRPAWGEQDRGPSVWLCWGSETQPPKRRQTADDPPAGRVSGSQSI